MPRIGIFSPSQRQQPFIEFNAAANEWRIYIAFNPDVTSGTYLALSPTGAVERVTFQDDTIMEIVNVTQVSTKNKNPSNSDKDT